MSGVAAQILEIRSRNLIQPQLMCCCAWLTPANQHSIQPNQHLQHPTRWFLRCVSLSFSSQDVPSQKEKHGLTIPTTTIRHHPASSGTRQDLLHPIQNALPLAVFGLRSPERLADGGPVGVWWGAGRWNTKHGGLGNFRLIHWMSMPYQNSIIFDAYQSLIRVEWCLIIKISQVSIRM